MSKKLKIGFLFFLFFVAVLALPNQIVKAANNSQPSLTCAVYFTGIGCPHCARTDPVIFKQLLAKYPNLVVIEYEIYQTQGNGKVLEQYFKAYNIPYNKRGVPGFYFGKSPDQVIVGDGPILSRAENEIKNSLQNKCLLSDGSEESFSDLDIDKLPGQPKIWSRNRILAREGRSNKWIFAWNGEKPEPKYSGTENPTSTLNKLIEAKDIKSALIGINYNVKTKQPFAAILSGDSVSFRNAVEITVNSSSSSTVPGGLAGQGESGFNLTKIISLALVDALNPCALAVLILMLTAILTYNPERKRNVLFSGLAFVAAVFIIYFFYGLVIIKFFKTIQALAPIKLWFYKILGAFALILGVLNIRDYFSYKPGRLGTEMPLLWRPKVKKLISGVTSPKGAFVVGSFVTLFLLPCTIGPYVIAGGILSAIEALKSVPLLLLYNSIFVLPMLLVVFIIYWGVKEISEVEKWKEKNITKLHLLAGIIMLFLGVAMIIGWG